eukprot:NODE_590_length_1580_cov_77.104507_g485_i0.p1 GENE.NODE_590_length_1580_cov_77.104507_g485_i0~~NODE_590_length_1580_cov_77.104507_g485_i0.p1  ORF type:complete len:506 (-),score=147.62 NODE_590_length_1580_cov_77.104507_g485_i0:61-1503(-)
MFLRDGHLAEVRGSSLLEARAIGKFFKIDKPCGYGEYPLHFAACTKQPAIFEFLVETDPGALLKLDVRGNNILHVLVYRELPEEFDMVLEHMKRIHGEEYKEFLKARNDDGHTPLTLAAAIDSREMFTHILKLGKITVWEFGPVSCNAYPLQNVTPQATVGGKSALEVLGDVHGTEFMDIQLLTKVIDSIWETRVKHRFVHRIIIWFIYALICTAALFTHRHIPGTWIDWVLDSFVMIGIVYKLFMEVRQILTNGLKDYVSEQGAGFFENTMSLAFGVCSTTAIMLDIFSVNEALSNGLYGISFLLVWGYALFFFLGFELSGPFVVMIFQMIKTDMARFMLIYVSLWIGFSGAMYVLGPDSSFSAFLSSMLHMFYASLGAFDLETFQGGQSDLLSIMLLTVWLMWSAVLLLNLLIAMMGNTFAAVTENAHRVWLLELVRIILSLDNETRSTDTGERYWIEIGGEQYYQIEEVGSGLLSDE